MKKIIFLPIILLATLTAFCQLNFENLSFDGALQKAKQTSQIIFLQYESENCSQCNQVADKAFEDKKLSTLIEQTFLCIKISAENPDRQKVAAKYNKKADGFGTLFLSPDGTLLHNYPGTTTYIKTYEEHIDKALTKAGEGLRISELEKQYNTGNKSLGLMELLIETRRTLNLATDSLLDEYATLLPVDSLKSERTLLFIIKIAPVIESKAYQKMLQDYSSFLNAWKLMTRGEKIVVNNRIGTKSLQKAIREKNEPYAFHVANYMKSTNSKNSNYGQKQFDAKMVDFYKGVNDTLKYIQRAITFYDNYYMTIVVDSIKMKDSLNRRNLLNAVPFTSEKKGDTLIQMRKIKYAPIVQVYNRELNDAASSFYELTTDSTQLSKALQWSARANEFIQTYISVNTHAQLLYKTGKKEEAIEWQKKSIALKKKQGFDIKDLEQELAEMHK